MISSATAAQRLPGLALKDGIYQLAAPFVAPIYQTGVTTGHYIVFDVGTHVAPARNLKIAPGGNFPRILSKLSENPFTSKHFGLEEPIPANQVARYPGEQGKTGAVAGVQAVTESIVAAGWEQRVFSLATGGSVQSASPATKWDQANSDPSADVSAAGAAIHLATGLVANVMVVSHEVYEVLKLHPKVLEAVKLGGGYRWADALASFFDVEKFVVATAVVADDEDTLSPVSVWGDSVLLCRTDLTRNMMAPSFARTFLTTTDPEAPAVSSEVYEEPGIHAQVVRAEHTVAETLTGAELGYHLSNVLAAI